MKKLLVVLALLLVSASANAEILLTNTIDLKNYWEHHGIEFQKVDYVSRKLIHDNGLKRATVSVERNWRVANAATNKYAKSIIVNTGLLPYISNDDELAFVVAHELAHAQECYGGATKLIAMYANSKKYEYKADLKAIDYMVKSGFNPIAAIIIGNKIFDEPLWDWGFTYSHPKGSKRLVKIYEYIYKKYPSYLNSDMAKNYAYLDALKHSEKEINSFHQKQAKKQMKDL